MTAPVTRVIFEASWRASRTSSTIGLIGWRSPDGPVLVIAVVTAPRLVGLSISIA